MTERNDDQKVDERTMVNSMIRRLKPAVVNPPKDMNAFIRTAAGR